MRLPVALLGLLAGVLTGCAHAAERVWIPPGSYVVGCADQRVCPGNPRRHVRLDGYWIDRYEVTGRTIVACGRARACTGVPRGARPATARHVVAVTRTIAHQVCRWRRGRVPTDDEWEVAARGSDERLYPWGDRFDEARLPRQAVLMESLDLALMWWELGRERAGDSPFGVSDIAGTLPEHTGSISEVPHVRGAPVEAPSDALDYSTVRVHRAPRGTAAAVRCVYRGR